MVFNGFLHQVWLHHRAELGGVQLGTSGVFLMSPSDVTAKLQPASSMQSASSLASSMQSASSLASSSQEPQIKPADLVLVRGVVQVMMASDAPSDGLSDGLSVGL
jgi:hypothetical protein